MHWLEFGPRYLARASRAEERLQIWWEGKKEITPPQARNVSAELVEQVDLNAEKLAPSMVDREIAFEAQPYDNGEDTRGPLCRCHRREWRSTKGRLKGTNKRQ